MKIWTVYSDYFATGEGRTLSACICNAETAEEALGVFKRAVANGDYFSLGAKVEEGIVKNDITELLFSDNILSRKVYNCYFYMASQFHFNYS